MAALSGKLKVFNNLATLLALIGGALLAASITGFGQTKILQNAVFIVAIATTICYGIEARYRPTKLTLTAMSSWAFIAGAQLVLATSR